VTGNKGERTMTLSNPPPQPENKLLTALSRQSYKHLAPQLEFVRFALGDTLYHPKQQIKYVYFPHKTIVSMVNILEDGSMVEISVVGRKICWVLRSYQEMT
jgi:hypothetical protein